MEAPRQCDKYATDNKSGAEGTWSWFGPRIAPGGQPRGGGAAGGVGGRRRGVAGLGALGGGAKRRKEGVWAAAPPSNRSRWD